MFKITDNKRFFLNINSTVLLIYGISSLPSFFVALLGDQDYAARALGPACVICIVAGLFMKFALTRDMPAVKPKIDYITTTANWFIIIALTAIIYYFGRAEFTIADSIFEATANLTTTGIGVLDTSILPTSLQLWRATLNWLGGIGIILISASFFPSNMFTGHALITTEIPGPEFLKSTVTFRAVYRLIINIYIFLTVLQFILLVIAGMDPFNSILTSLSNISTSGMQHINNGVITDLSLGVKIIITVFAFLGSINVSFFILLFLHKTLMLNRRTEVRMYTVRILLTALLITLFVILHNSNTNPFSTFGNALMQTVSFLSTAGYIITDCHTWPVVCQIILMLQMFIGACAVSTGGGIKIARVRIMLETISLGLFRHIHPHAVKPIRFQDESLKSAQIVQANVFIILFMTIYLVGALFLSIDNTNDSIFDALNYSQAMLTNTGVSIEELAAPGLATHFSPLSKIIMSIEMLMGRLEIYPVLMLFFKGFWIKEKNN